MTRSARLHHRSIARWFPALLAVLVAAVTATTGPRAPAQPAIDLQLVLAVDVSGSVNEARFELQKEGYVAAFRNPRLLDAIRAGAGQAIAVTMTQWTGPSLQVQVVPWMLVSDETSMHAVAIAIERAPRQLFTGGTSISGAIDYATTLFDKTEFRAARRVIDVSGDGANNRGRPAADARDDAVRTGIGINGLPDSGAGAGPGAVLSEQCHRRPRSFRRRRAILRDLCGCHPQEARHGDCGRQRSHPPRRHRSALRLRARPWTRPTCRARRPPAASCCKCCSGAARRP